MQQSSKESFLKIKKNPKFDGVLKDFILCTNIDLDYEDLENHKIGTNEIHLRDDFLSIEGANVKPKRFTLKVDAKTLLYVKLKECTELHFLSEALISHIKDPKTALTLKSNIFRSYHAALINENVIERISGQNIGKFHEKFVKNDPSLSESAKKLRDIIQRYFDYTKTAMDDVEFKLNKNFGKSFKLHRNPQIENVENFVKELVDLLESDRPVDKRVKLIKHNIDKLAGHVLVKKSEHKNDHVYFSSTFINANSTLCGNLSSFRSELMTA